MTQNTRSWYYAQLKEAGVEFTKHYRNYSTDELADAYSRLVNKQQAEAPDEGLEAAAEEYGGAEPTSDEPAPAGFFGYEAEEPEPVPEPVQEVPTAGDEFAGQRLNTKEPDEPLYTDENGRVWFQKEVQKPATPKPRGRRVLKMTHGVVKTESVQVGQYIETFEVEGEGSRVSEIKITLPSYQVGIFKDPRFPFRVHTYSGRNGFSLEDVQNFYGGADLVPSEIKRVYIANDLCYDIRTTVRSIQTEYRHNQLQGRA